MNAKQLQSFQSWHLRLLPITLPFAAFLTAALGLANHSQQFLDLDNIVFVLVGGTLSGLLPMCFVFGAIFLIANGLHPSKRHYYFAISIIIIFVMLMYAYKVGQNLDF